MKSQSKTILYLASVLIGIAVFCLVASVRFLDPTSLDTFHYSDNFQHHLSTVFFRNSSWSLPLGLNPQYGLLEHSTLVYADPIPLIAVILKIVTPWVPASFQYLGIWTLSCLILQATFAQMLMGLLTKNISLRILGVGFFLFVPSLLIRVGMHAALVGQFSILAAMYLSFSKRNQYDSFCWIALLVLCASVNFYLFFLISVIWFSSILDRCFSQQSISVTYAISEFFIAAILVGITFWQFGYFVGKTENIAAGGFGFYQMNLLAPFDPQGWSYIFKNMTPTPPTIEGFVFLGLGVLLLIPIAITKKAVTPFSYKSVVLQYRFLFFSLICLFLLAISNRVLIGNFIFEYPIPKILFELGGIVRSSGRMFWPIGYILIFSLVALIIKKFSTKQAQWILAIGLAIQIIDTSAGWLPARSAMDRISNLGRDPQFEHPFWNGAAKHYKNVISIIPQKLYDESWNWIPVAKYAADHKMGTNSAYLSRIVPLENRPINNANYEYELDKGLYESNNLYILSEQKILSALGHMNPEFDVLAKINNIVVFAPDYKKCLSCLPIDTELSLFQPIAATSVDHLISFKKSSVFARFPYLIEGWNYPESWGTWSNGKKSAIAIPLPKNQSYTSLVFNMRALVSPTHQQQGLAIWVNGTIRLTIKLIELENNIITIPMTQEDKSKNYLIVGMHYSDSTSPEKIGLGGDDRNLAIGLVSASFK